MTSKPPPPRYRVIERGRRLEVIDLWDTRGRPDGRKRDVAAPDRAAKPEPRFNAPRAGGKPTGPTFVTSPWYDARGPRQVTLEADALAELVWIPFAAIILLLPLLLLGTLAFPILIGAAFLFANWGGHVRFAGKGADWIDAHAVADTGSSAG